MARRKNCPLPRLAGNLQVSPKINVYFWEYKASKSSYVCNSEKKVLNLKYDYARKIKGYAPIPRRIFNEGE